MDRARVIALTLSLIAAIAVQLCASSGWARGLGVLGLGGGMAPQSYFIDDTFTESANVILSSHSPEVGGAWSFDTAIGGSLGQVYGGSGYVKQTSNNSATFAINSAAPPSADYTVTVVGNCGTASSYTSSIGPCVRMTATGGGYCARFEPNGPSSKILVFEKNSNATWSDAALGYTVFINATNTTYRVSITATGSSITAQVRLDSDGSLVAEKTVIDDTYSNAGTAGLILGPNTNQYITRVYAE